MSTVLVTLAIAFVVVLLAVGLLGLSWLLKGRSTLRPGSCGRDPTKKQDDEECGTDTTCSVCKPCDKKKDK